MSITLVIILAVNILLGIPVCVGRCQQPAPPPRVMLPQQNLLVVDEFRALRVDQLPSKVLILQQVQKVQTHGVLQVFGVFRFLPVEQVLEIVDERAILEVAPLGQD
jgi:hypothetical protein